MIALGRHQVIQGDCIEVMRGMEADSVDAVVCDPPYGLEFMNKDWDKFSPDPDVGKMSKNGFQKASGKPDNREQNKGGTWFGSRDAVAPNYYRTTNAKCRNCGKWKISGGHDGKGNTLGCKCETPDFPNVRGESMLLFQEWCTEWAIEALRVAKPGAYLLAAGSPRTYHRLACAIEDAGWVLIDCIQHLHGQGFPKGKGQLKPAYEPWTLARKPAPRVLPLQIDACRIGTSKPPAKNTPFNSWRNLEGRNDRQKPEQTYDASTGRWPANIILDEAAAIELDETAGSLSTCGGPKKTTHDSGMFGIGQPGTVYPDKGGPARFFYTPKASRSERGEGNSHPTVKPLALMRWLARLVTPPSGTVLDPFGGSGTTLLACEQEGFSSILIEREAEYVDIIIQRSEQMTKQPALPEVG